MPMKNPVHPGRIVRHDCLKPLGLTVTAGAKVLVLSTSWAVYNTGMDTFVHSARGNQMYLLAANQNYIPDSGVINPDGTLQSHIRQSTGIAYGYLPAAYGVGTEVAVQYFGERYRARVTAEPLYDPQGVRLR